MLKNIFILFFSVNLCCADPVNEPKLSRSNDSSRGVFWLDVAVLLACTIVPNIVKDLKKSEAAELNTDIEAEETVPKKSNRWKRIAVNALEAISLIASVYIIYTGVKVFAAAGKDFYNYLYPSAEALVRIEKAKKSLAMLEAQRNFRECLMKNAKSLRNQEGIPVSCEDCGRLFALTSGTDAYDDMVKRFKKYYSKS